MGKQSHFNTYVIDYNLQINWTLDYDDSSLSHGVFCLWCCQRTGGKKWILTLVFVFFSGIGYLWWIECLSLLFISQLYNASEFYMLTFVFEKISSQVQRLSLGILIRKGTNHYILWKFYLSVVTQLARQCWHCINVCRWILKAKYAWWVC